LAPPLQNIGGKRKINLSRVLIEENQDQENAINGAVGKVMKQVVKRARKQTAEQQGQALREIQARADSDDEY
jgi:hypothetical protein